MDTTLKNMIVLKSPINGDKERTTLAEWLACAVDGDKRVGHPYMPNNRTDYWTLDRGNDWKVSFDDSDPWVISLRHRYSNKEALDALTRWAAYRFGGAAIHETERKK